MIVGRWYAQLAAIWHWYLHWYLPFCIYIKQAIASVHSFITFIVIVFSNLVLIN